MYVADIDILINEPGKKVSVYLLRSIPCTYFQYLDVK